MGFEIKYNSEECEFYHLISFAGGNYYSQIVPKFVVVSPLVFSIWILVGAGMAALGALSMAKRFSLRWLLFVVLLLGALGAVPFQVMEIPGLVARVTIIFDRPLDQAHFHSMQELLHPKAAMATLPAGLLKELELEPGEGIERVEVTGISKPNAHHPGIECRIEFHQRLPAWKRDLLTWFYDNYFELLALRRAQAQGMTSVSAASSTLGTGGGGARSWSFWKTQWERQLPAETLGPQQR